MSGRDNVGSLPGQHRPPAISTGSAWRGLRPNRKALQGCLDNLTCLVSGNTVKRVLRRISSRKHRRGNKKTAFLIAQKRRFLKGREGVEPSRDGFAIRCLSHLATAPNEIWEPWVDSTAPAGRHCYSEYIGTWSRPLQANPSEISEEANCCFWHTWRHRLPLLLKLGKIQQHLV
jgi:hypothetical protein